eukprot:TRINITY_DN2639_c0_g2_i4.p1 TRINITY_DN2639_c0_g2~~TRINITY_DN2639_c0_g2_i4.p1  ORF type:complete len:727 (+),score=277.64 TRINITY_DN2639_c0_g2_i4:71-2182(+)
MAHAALLYAAASASIGAAYPRCSAEGGNTCPAGMECDPILLRCYHMPRQLGEPCGTVLKVRKCAAYDTNTSHPLTCSTWCGTCVIADIDPTHPTTHDDGGSVPTRLTIPAGAAAGAADGTLSQPSLYWEGRKRARAGLPADAPLPVVSRCGVSSTATYINFEQSLATDMPILYPKNDAEMGALMATVAGHGCKLRPVGAGHSSPAVIAGDGDVDFVGVSLAEYTPDDLGWNMTLDAQGRVRAPAGISLFDLYHYTRPQGWFLESQTAGPIFTLGGVIANSVHGGVHGKGYLNQYVTALRVGVWTGTAMAVRVITDEAELRHWRNSYGVLGVMLAVEMQLNKRQNFAITTTGHTFSEAQWSRDYVDAYFNKIVDGKLYSESFFNPYLREVKHVIFEAAAPVPPACVNFTSDATCSWDYPHAKCADAACCEYRYKFGDMNLDESCRTSHHVPNAPSWLQQVYAGLASAFKSVRFNGSPDLPAAQNDEICVLERLAGKFGKVFDQFLAMIFYDMTFSHVASSVTANGNDVNDGFWLRSVPHEIRLMAYSVPRARIFDFLNLIRSVFLDVTAATGTVQLANVEFRFFNMSDTATLMPTGLTSGAIAYGAFVNCELVFNSNPGSPNTKQWQQALYEYETRVRALDGIPHTGKSFCYLPDGEGGYQPYMNKTCVKGVFNNGQKAAFGAYRTATDPAGLFDGGAAEEFFL